MRRIGRSTCLIFALPITGWIHDSAWEGAPTHPFLLWGVVPHVRIGAIEALDAATKEQIHTIFFALPRLVRLCARRPVWRCMSWAP